MHPILRVLFFAIPLLAPAAAPAEESLTRRDARGPVTVAATLLPADGAGAPVKVRIVLDTHSVALDAIALERAVALRKPDGTDVAPTAVEATGGGHHRQAVLTFAASEAGTPLRIVVKDVGGVAERVFTWESGLPR